MPVVAFFVGKCGANDTDLTNCTGGCNVGKLGGSTCAGKNSCEAGQNAGIKFFCSGGQGRKNSCKV